jgi:hypothetical protein
MGFDDTTIDAIKSITQRSLAMCWYRAARDRPFPSINDFNPDSRVHDGRQLAAWKVERDGGQCRFRALYQGGNVAEVFQRSWAGQTMDEIMPAFAKGLALDAANECAMSGCAIYTVVSTRDALGHRVDCERLLLPLGHDGIEVEQIVTSLQLISPKGTFTRADILARFGAHAELTFCGKIPSAFARGKLQLAPQAG